LAFGLRARLCRQPETVEGLWRLAGADCPGRYRYLMSLFAFAVFGLAA